jgi:hypothetical protein
LPLPDFESGASAIPPLRHDKKSTITAPCTGLMRVLLAFWLCASLFGTIFDLFFSD